eukprot:NODE_5072_length_533_cov_168.411157_g3741_i0.p2 GENE.NODE_5072_length_533_cov_168.411157_g3741_i0~~NODE_5072_length_533_cov_168.411157_g3741_i0.p2  ORF type:complete len:146 (+),score=57.69 NODE_5072_length_533_cov_168.411157_g3741_i0:26-439(+)
MGVDPMVKKDVTNVMLDASFDEIFAMLRDRDALIVRLTPVVAKYLPLASEEAVAAILRTQLRLSSPLRLACSSNQPRALALLLAAGADWAVDDGCGGPSSFVRATACIRPWRPISASCSSAWPMRTAGKASRPRFRY